MSENAKAIVWKVLGPLSVGLLVTAAGIAYGAVDKRISRLELLIDELVPTMSRIEENTRNTEYMLREHVRGDQR